MWLAAKIQPVLVAVQVVASSEQPLGVPPDGRPPSFGSPLQQQAVAPMDTYETL